MKSQNKTNSKFFPGLAVLVGTAIGAGYLGMPSVISKSGFFPGVLWIFLIGLFVLFIQLYLGEVVLRTKGNHQLTGYAEKYLGKTGKILMFFAMIFGIYSALTAYLIGEGESLSYAFTGNGSFSNFFSLGFWLFMAGLTNIGLKALKKYEKIALMIFAGVLIVIFALFAGRINFDNLAYTDSGSIFLPFGIILFSFLAFSAMPETRRVISGQEKLMKRIIISSIGILLFVYVLFTAIVIGNFGKNVPEIATMALGRGFSILGVLTMFTAFFTLTLAIRDMFRFDFKLGRFRGWLFAIFVPLILFLVIQAFNLVSFSQILSLSGIVSGGLTGILVLLMNIKAKSMGDRKPEYSISITWKIISLMSLIFIAAVIAEFFI